MGLRGVGDSALETMDCGGGLSKEALLLGWSSLLYRWLPFLFLALPDLTCKEGSIHRKPKVYEGMAFPGPGGHARPEEGLG